MTSGRPAPEPGRARRIRLPLVRSNLLHDRRRTAVGILGVAFAAILMFMQLGFLGSVRSTAVTILDKLDFDILLVSPTYLYVYDSGTFPRLRLAQARSLSGVRDAVPLYLGFNNWTRQTAGRRNHLPGPMAEDPDAQRAIFTIGFPLAEQPFRPSAFEALRMRIQPPAGDGACRPVLEPADLAALKQPDTMLYDRLSHRDFGPLEELDPCATGPGTAAPGPGKIVVGARQVRIVGGFDLAIGFGADGALIVGDQNYSRLFGGRSLNDVSLGLIRTTDGVDPERVAARLARYLPAADVRVLTRAEILAQETAYWVREKPVGVIFGLGLLVACAVGMVFVYQILSSDITNRFGEFATLKAMGYPDRVVSGLVVKQALVLSHAGYVPALVAAAILDRLVTIATTLPVELTWPDALTVYVASIVICTASALLSVGKVRRADPAELFA